MWKLSMQFRNESLLLFERGEGLFLPKVVIPDKDAFVDATAMSVARTMQGR